MNDTIATEIILLEAEREIDRLRAEIEYLKKELQNAKERTA